MRHVSRQHSIAKIFFNCDPPRVSLLHCGTAATLNLVPLLKVTYTLQYMANPATRDPCTASLRAWGGQALGLHICTYSTQYIVGAGPGWRFLLCGLAKIFRARKGFHPSSSTPIPGVQTLILYFATQIVPPSSGTRFHISNPYKAEVYMLRDQPTSHLDYISFAAPRFQVVALSARIL